MKKREMQPAKCVMGIKLRMALKTANVRASRSIPSSQEVMDAHTAETAVHKEHAEADPIRPAVGLQGPNQVH